MCYRILIPAIYLLALLPAGGACLNAQPLSGEDSLQALSYLDSRLSSLDRYLDRSERIQQRLLHKLQKKEQRMLQKLSHRDTVAYRHYIDNPLSYDSIARMAGDSSVLRKAALRTNTLTDSLKRLQHFISGARIPLGQTTARAPDYTERLAAMQQKLNVQQQLKDALQQKGRQLESWAGTKNIAGVKEIQKKVYYAGEQLKTWRQLADEPDAAEEKALEYLQGLSGFEKALAAPSPYAGMTTEEDLQKAGYQTRKMTEDMLRSKMGNQAAAWQQKMGGQVGQYQRQLNDKLGKVNEAVGKGKAQLEEIKEARAAVNNLKETGFRKNPQRAKPFLLRWQTQYNLQFLRASADGLRPAMAEIGASLSYKHNDWLSAGLGIALPVGLGKGWQQLKLSYEGISFRSFIEGQWGYGIALQGGYERMFVPAGRPYIRGDGSPGEPQLYSAQPQTAYIGIKKAYRITKKWQGSLLIAYNFLAAEGYHRSPFLLRMGWEK